jgi:uncharacterized protein YtpQ (UPF0354 family)
MMIGVMRQRVGGLEVQVAVGFGMRRALAVLREERAFMRAVRRMPKPVPWDWARSRLLPLLSGPSIDDEADGPLRAVVDPGISVVFGIDLGSAFPLVDLPVMKRWECILDQVRTAALHNLAVRAAKLDRAIVRSGSMSGHQIRVVDGRPAWASSLVLVPDELRRLLGDEDQIIATPSRAVLLSLPTEMPSRVAADIVTDFESQATLPLLLDAFYFRDGSFGWTGTEEWDEDAV